MTVPSAGLQNDMGYKQAIPKDLYDCISPCQLQNYKVKSYFPT